MILPPYDCFASQVLLDIRSGCPRLWLGSLLNGIVSCESVWAAKVDLIIVKLTYLLPSTVSHLYGFGLMDAEAMVMEAEKWTTVPQQHVCVESTDRQIK